MYIPVIILIAAVMIADQGMEPMIPLPVGWSWVVPLVVYLPPLACLLLETVLVRRTIVRASSGSVSVLFHAGRRLRIIQWIAVCSCLFALIGLGWLELIRSWTGDTIALDELIAVLPSLLLACLAWAVQWPLEKFLHDARVMNRIDRGLPVHPVASRGAHLFSQARSHLLVILVPAVLVLAGVELAHMLVFALAEDSTAQWLAPITTTGTALVLVMVAPFFVIHAIGARPLPEGAVRTALEEIIRARKVGVGNIMLWPTGGTMLNGAVIGFLPRLRYVLLTDGLIESLPADELKAVMAHEVGHLANRHLPWTCGVLLALVWIFGLAFDWFVPWIHHALVWSGIEENLTGSGIQTIGTILVFLAAFLVYGWVSRRFERQADLAAATDLSETREESETGAESMTITTRGAALMCGALESVAVFNGIDPARNTWRHGSIRWRQQHLLRSIGQPVDRLEIDVQVRWIKGVTIVVLLGLALLAIIDLAMLDSVQAL